VDWWEIWNEPDLGFFWMGTARDYARLLTVSYTVIRRTDPGARVIMAGMVDPSMAFLRTVLAVIRWRSALPSGAGGVFDVAAWHAYGPAAAVYTNLNRLRTLLDGDGFVDVPIWVTEDGFPASNPNGEPRQAAFVLQTTAYAFAGGAERVLVYRASDDPLPKRWGLLTSTGTPRMGYLAFQEAAHYLTNIRAISYAPTAQVERFVFYEPGRRVTLLWSQDQVDHTVELPASQPSAAAVDTLGASTNLTPEDGLLKLVVPGAGFNRGVDPRNSVVGGYPVLEIEANPPTSGLTRRVYVPPLAGSNRQLVLVNQGEAPAPFQVASADDPRYRISGQVAARSVGIVDLDLFAGPAYQGAYSLTTSAPLVESAGSNSASVQNLAASPTWYIADAPRALTFDNAAQKTANVELHAYGTHGRQLARATLSIPAGSSMSWVAPLPNPSTRYSVSAQSSTPLVVTDPLGASVGGVSSTRPEWYALRPRGRKLVIFNPNSTPTDLDVQFAGPSAIAPRQIRLGAGESTDALTQDANAVTVSATGGIVVSAGRPGTAPVAMPVPATQAALGLAGGRTHVDVFNPSATPAHVTISLVGDPAASEKALVVQPSHIYSVSAKNAGGAAGVLVVSDVPVAAAPR
jgi:hypothetical protein